MFDTPTFIYRYEGGTKDASTIEGFPTQAATDVQQAYAE